MRPPEDPPPELNHAEAFIGIGRFPVLRPVLRPRSPGANRGADLADGGVEITDAWARATPGGAENGAAYLTLMSPTGDRLTGVTSPAAAKAQLHEMTNDGGVMKMRDVTAIDLPPGKPVTLKPGGLHVMMMGLTHPLQPGQSVPLTLHFDKAGAREVSCRGRQGRRDGTGIPLRFHAEHANAAFPLSEAPR